MKKQPQSIMLPPPCLMAGIVFFFAKHAVCCSHQRAPVLSRQTTISYPRSQLAFRDDHGQILDEHGRAWSSGEGSFAENGNIFLLDGGYDQLYLG